MDTVLTIAVPAIIAGLTAFGGAVIGNKIDIARLDEKIEHVRDWLRDHIKRHDAEVKNIHRLINKRD